jgi:hypothetical protein
MKRWRHLVLLVWVGLPALAYANGLSMDDFAYGIRIQVPAGIPVAAVSLPEAVYRRASRTDLGDIRVFNESGEPVPHLLRYARSRKADAPWRPLPYFPIPEEAHGTIPDYGIYVRIAPDGTITQIVRPTLPAAESPGRTVLIDASRMGSGLAELRLEWPAGTMNRMVFFSLAASDDLVAWRRLIPRAMVADIHYGGHRLSNHAIVLPPNGQRYLRLRQLNDGPAIALTAIQGRSRAEGQRAVRALLTIDGRRMADQQGGYEYDTKGAFPVDRVNLLFNQPNSMADAHLFSRSTQEGEWRRRTKGLFYRIDMQGTPLTGAPQSVPVCMDRYWRLTVDASESTIGQMIPRLEIGYRPHDLFFIARGSGPFTLAFGSTRAELLKTNVAALVDSINQDHEDGIEQWVFPQGPPFVLGGVKRLAPQARPVPTRRIVLWSILLAGVLIVAAMAWRLARRLKP